MGIKIVSFASSTNNSPFFKSFGMRDIDTVRITARIPIIQFVDEKTGIECDVCVNNPLALRNTRLMRSYSLADIRVREVAYMIKKWSKRRDINDPARSTLSSYGYILTVINSLQHGGWVDPRKAKGGQAYSPLLNNLQPFGKNHHVAHVLRPVSNKRTREEFVRAYCILAGIGQYKKIKHGKALELLFEKYIEPVEEEEENDVTDGGNAEEKK